MKNNVHKDETDTIFKKYIGGIRKANQGKAGRWVDKNTQWKMNSIFTNLRWSKFMAAGKRMQVDPCLTSCTKLNDKWIKRPQHKTRHTEPDRRQNG